MIEKCLRDVDSNNSFNYKSKLKYRSADSSRDVKDLHTSISRLYELERIRY